VRATVLRPVAITLVALAALALGARGAAAAPEAVAVAWLEPKTELAVDVVSGQLSVTSDTFPLAGPGEDDLAGLLDPYDGRLYTYETNGIPGVPRVVAPAGSVQLPAPGAPPVWSAPRLVPVANGEERVVLADGRYATVRTDARGRVVSLVWPDAHGSSLTTRIRYRARRTVVALPLAPPRTYRLDTQGLVTSVSSAGARATSRDAVAGVLDSLRTHAVVERRVGQVSRQERLLFKAASRAVFVLGQEDAANGGTFTVRVDSLSAVRRVERAIVRAGLADVAQAIPERVSSRAAAAEANRLSTLIGALAPCHASTGALIGAGPDVRLASSVSEGEVSYLDTFLGEQRGYWIYVLEGGSSECIELD
jgi:hypothetical protein